MRRQLSNIEIHTGDGFVFRKRKWRMRDRLYRRILVPYPASVHVRLLLEIPSSRVLTDSSARLPGNTANPKILLFCFQTPCSKAPAPKHIRTILMAFPGVYGKKYSHRSFPQKKWIHHPMDKFSKVDNKWIKIPSKLILFSFHTLRARDCWNFGRCEWQTILTMS